MRGERPQLFPVEDLDPVQRLWRELPAPWRGPVIGPGIDNWAAITENGERRLDLTGLPDPFPIELPRMCTRPTPSSSRSATIASAIAGMVGLPGSAGERPCPGRSAASTR